MRAIFVAESLRKVRYSHLLNTHRYQLADTSYIAVQRISMHIARTRNCFAAAELVSLGRFVSCWLKLGTDVAGHRLSMTGPRGGQVQCRELADRSAGFVGVVIAQWGMRGAVDTRMVLHQMQRAVTR